MALLPKRVKYRKAQRGRRRGMSLSGAKISFGECGLQATSNGWVKNTQIEAARITIMHHIKGGAKLYIRVFPDKPVSKKPAETRMGKGKGAPEFWVSVIKRGKIIFEMEGAPEDVACEALRRAAHKLPIRTRFVKRAAH